MRLSLVKLTLRNWKCYRDQVIDLHQDEDQNISVIFGNNGFGKTSLLEAIRWCLYGGEALGSDELLRRFNRVVSAENPELELSVELVFRQGEHTYRISRTAKRAMRGTTATAIGDEPMVFLDGENQDAARAVIDQLLPFACSEFFFFDGVEIKRYAQNVQSATMKDAIERVLGIPELRNLREDSKRAMDSLDVQINAVRKQSPELERISGDLASREDEAGVLRGQIDLTASEHDAAISILESLKIEANSQESVRAKLDELDRKGRERDRVSGELATMDIEIERALRLAPIPLLLEYVREQVSDIQRQSLSTTRRGALVSQLEGLLDSPICICGRPMDESAKQHVAGQIKSTAGVTLTVEAIREDNLKATLEALSRYKSPEIELALRRRDQLVTDVDSLTEEIARLKAETGDVSPGHAAELWRKVGEAEMNVKSRRESLQRLREVLQTLEGSIGSLRRERETLASRQQETAQLAEQARLARGLFEAASELIAWRIDETRSVIEDETSKIHHAVTNKPDEYVGVEIADIDYSLRVRNAAGRLLEPESLSAGEKEALAFAFIAGLNIASGKSAPFVMDTPFGHLDINHQRNLVEALPKLPSQITLLATDRDLPPQLLELIRPRIADELLISRMGATEDASIIGAAS